MTMIHMFRGLFLISAFSFLAVGCYHCPVMDCVAFESIEIGEAIDSVVECVGPAYCIEECENGGLKYTWISRQRLGPDLYRHRDYVAMVDDDGLVTDRWWNEEEQHQFQFSSWEPEQADYR
ncbi:hypothetical protein SCG7086_AC_00290 [Chlamydiales bacterium SCGC AG-110-P3]|nr:hypothetical protein SCG7086_AC_00290 [Chlamydiales bacterium SCGC AG-110-P3]